MTTARLHDYGKLVSIPVQRKLTSLLSGMHQGLRAGSSHEFLDMEEYKAGDDVSDIDWKATARHNRAVVKRFEATATLNAYLLIDAGANMAATAAVGPLQTKQDVALEFTTAMCWLTALRGDHLGLVVGNAQQVRSVPARSGVAHAQKVLRIAQTATVDGPAASVGRLADRIRLGTAPRSILIVVTDHHQVTLEVVASLRRLRVRHRVLVFLVDDYDPTEVAAPGLVREVGGGALPEFLANDPTIAYQWSNTRRALREQAELRLTQSGLRFATAGSREDVLPALLELFESGRRRG